MTAFAFDPFGQIAAPTREALTELDESSAILAYSHGTADDGRPYYAYIAVKPSLYAEFYRRCAAGETFPLGDYGEILASDYTAGPTPEVIRIMREVYGFDENYEAAIKQEVLRQQKEFLDAEKARIDGIVNVLKNKNEDKK